MTYTIIGHCLLGWILGYYVPEGRIYWEKLATGTIRIGLVALPIYSGMSWLA